jgi:acetyl esterase
MSQFLLLFSRFVLISLGLFLDVSNERRVFPLAKVLIPMHYIHYAILLPSFQDAEADPHDSVMPEEIQNYLRNVVQPSFGAREVMAIESAIAGDNRQLIALRQPAPPFECPESVILEDKLMAGPVGAFRVRSYRPRNTAMSDLPVLIYIHGGGWVNGNLGRRDAYCAMLAKHLLIQVMSVNYTLSPEVRPGVSLQECFLVWRSVSNRIVMLSGDSSGGNLAAGLTIKIMNEKTEYKLPEAVILIYPVIDLTNTSYFSYRRFEKGYGLDLARMRTYIKAYVPDKAMRKLPMYSPINANVSRFPPCLVLTAQFDLLRDEGRAFAKKLLDNGRLVRYRCLEGAIHSSHHRPEIPLTRQKVDDEILSFVREILRRKTGNLSASIL